MTGNCSETEDLQKFDIWTSLFENNKIIRSWANVLIYFESDSENKNGKNLYKSLVSKRIVIRLSDIN